MFNFSEDELSNITESQLGKLQRLLNGNEYLGEKGGQKTLWKIYSFDVIPIELISSIYQQFIRTNKNDEQEIDKAKKRDEDDTIHYTPPDLVAFIMDHLLPYNDDVTDVKILDPACGSGIFLVDAYRRLVNRWNRLNGTPKISDLSNLLINNIFGIDKDGEAIRIAAFSLYIT